MGRKISSDIKIIMKFSINPIKNWLLLLLLFILPWQTRLIYQTAYLGKDFWEYGSLSLYGSEILLGIIILFFLISKIQGGFKEYFVKHFDKKRLVIVPGLFLGILAIYFFSSTNSAITWQYLNWLIYGLCLSFIILESELSFKKMALAVWGGGLLQAFLGIWQFFNQFIPANKWLGMAVQDPHQLGVAVVEFGDERWLRAYGAFGWPNSLGIYLATIFILGIILICHSRASGNLEGKVDSRFHGGDNLWLLVGQNIILVGLFFSFARGAWVAAAVGIIFLLVKKHTSKSLWQQIGIYALTFIALLFIFKPLVFSRLDLNNRLEKMSLTQRVTQRTEFQQVFAKNYFVGSGPGNYTTVLHDLYPKYFVGDLKPVHNIYLLFIAEWGVLGVFLLSFLLLYRQKLFDWTFAPLVVLLVAGLFDHWNASTFTGLMLFCFIASLSIKPVAIDTKVSRE